MYLLITDDLVFNGNIGLVSLIGLEQVGSIEDMLLILDNTILEDVGGLSNPNTISGYFGFPFHLNVGEDDVDHAYPQSVVYILMIMMARARTENEISSNVQLQSLLDTLGWATEGRGDKNKQNRVHSSVMIILCRKIGTSDYNLQHSLKYFKREPR